MPGSADNPFRSHLISWVIAFFSILLSIACMTLGYVFFYQQKTISRSGVSLFFLAGAVLAGMFFWLINKFMLPHLRSLPRSVLWSLLVFSMVGGFFLLTFSPWGIPAYRLLPNHLQITSNGQKNPSAEGSVVELLGFQAGQDFISYQTFQKQGDWQQDGNVLRTERLGSLTWQGRLPDTVLIFRTFPRAGMVKVSWDGQSIIYDLFSAVEGQILVHDTHPIPVWNSWLMSILAGLCLGFLVLLILTVFVAVYNPDQPASPVIDKHSFLQDWTESTALLISLAGIVLFLLITRNFGLWIASDSGSYISAARHLAAWQGYISLDSDVYVWWPPLYPAVLAILELLPGGILTWALFLNALLLGGSIYLTWVLLKLVSPPGYRLPVLGLLLVLLSRALLSSYVFILSEPLFIILILIFLACLIGYFRDGSLPAAMIAVVSAALIPLTRYIGVVAIVVGSLAMLLFLKMNFMTRLLRSFVFGWVASLPILIWLGRNYRMDGSLTGIRTSSYTPLSENIQRTLFTLWDWIMVRANGAFWWIWFLVFIALVLGVFLTRPKGIRSLSSKQFFSVPVLILLFFSIFYICELIFSLSSVNNAPIGDRLLAPIFIPVFLLLLYLFEYLRTGFTQFSSKISRTLSFVLMAALLIAPTRFAIETAASQIKTSNAMISIYSPLASNDVIKELKQASLPGGEAIYSNCPRCVYLYAGIHPAVEFNDTPKYRNLPQDIPPFIIVWFNDIPPAGLSAGQSYRLPDLQAILGREVKITSLFESTAGKILRVQP